MQKIRQLYGHSLFRIAIGIFAIAGCISRPIAPPDVVPAEATPTMAQSNSRPLDGPLPIPTLAAAVTVPEIPLLEQRELINEIGINQLISFDGIRPVYQPLFASAQDTDMQPDDLVIGIAIDGQAKAYPVGVLRFREMVNDEIAGIPILVSW